eukprot:jgi/Astpho2/2893/Aster-x0546
MTLVHLKACSNPPFAGTEEPWFGKSRASMNTNVLIQHVDSGKIKRTTFATPPEDKVFGASRPQDPEGAREVIGIWKEHRPNPFAQPGPDFMAMNKKAALSGLTKSHQQHTFRQSHPVSQRVGLAASHVSAPKLPSDRQADFTYGKPSTYKSMEEIRVAGLENPVMKHLIQGAYGWQWMQMNDARAQEFSRGAHYIPPRLTRAALGHSTHRNAVSSAGSGEHQAPVRRPALETFKLSKFTDPRKIHAKVDTSTPPAIKTIRPIRDLRQTQTSVKAQ